MIGEGEALEAFYAALGAIEGVTKTEEADAGKFIIRYASLNAVLQECARACELHGLVICQEPTVQDGLFAVRTTLIHLNGGTIEFDPMCLPLPKEAQALGSATTYLRRYSLVSIFGIPVEDDDGQAATVAAQTQPGRRTEAERKVREIIAKLSAGQREAFITDFKDKFGVGLTDLPSNKHGEALTWTKEWEKDWVDPEVKPAEEAANE